MAAPLTATVTCDGCEIDYDGYWPPPEEDEEQDQAEAPVAPQTCPGCGHTQDEEFSGWSFHSEAG
jgi:hypothetical protein